MAHSHSGRLFRSSFAAFLPTCLVFSSSRRARRMLFFFFFCRVEAPSDSRSSLTIRPTLGKACSLELSTLVTRGNAVKQTTGR